MRCNYQLHTICPDCMHDAVNCVCEPDEELAERDEERTAEATEHDIDDRISPQRRPPRGFTYRGA